MWNHGRPVETFSSSSIHDDRPAGDHPASPSAARSPYWRGVSAARVLSRVSDVGMAGACAATTTLASAGTGTASAGEAAAADAASGAGTGSGASGGAVAGGVTSAFLEKSHMLRVARGRDACNRGW